MAPIILECRRRSVSYSIVHTGQHYSYNLDKIFFEEMGLGEAAYNLEVGSDALGEQLGKMLSGLARVLDVEKPSHVLAEGDTNSVLASALAAGHLGVPFVHVEAGLRSYNIGMQEEKNRIAADRQASVLLAPTPWAADVLQGEGADPRRVFVTGNTIVDALKHYLPIAEASTTLDRLGVKPEGYLLATLHRAENTDRPEVLERMLAGLEAAAREHGLAVIFPIHPRTVACIEAYGLTLGPELRTVDPVGFFEFLLLEKHARLVFTDSGGVQEECCILRVPCITFRDDTERPETLQIGSNVLAGTHLANLEEQVRGMLEKDRDWENPFGDGRAGERTIDILL
ncbi:MAG: UDP-N-acetylglucosamine 2-epimerase (non-hydrolyzing), partial [Dehalococcoidia bacterium]|nr:UDP-N-acetylglucosamine 2-epimerase (non-hydrolyzing) [Dehalococcoidia bacterium]